MSPEVARRKLVLIQQYLEDLAPYAKLSREEYEKHHYAVERIIELLVEASSDALSHLLVERGVPRPETYREVFLEAARRGLVPRELGDELAPFAGLRNILAHRYAEIEGEKVRASIPLALKTFRAVAREIAKLAND